MNCFYRSVADELRIFESIHNSFLVYHYGVEIHREEMLIFMEYCPEGTLESLLTSTENGLDEFMDEFMHSYTLGGAQRYQRSKHFPHTRNENYQTG